MYCLKIYLVVIGIGIVRLRWHKSKIVKLEFIITYHHVRLVKDLQDSIWIHNAQSIYLTPHISSFSYMCRKWPYLIASDSSSRWLWPVDHLTIFVILDSNTHNITKQLHDGLIPKKHVVSTTVCWKIHTIHNISVPHKRGSCNQGITMLMWYMVPLWTHTKNYVTSTLACHTYILSILTINFISHQKNCVFNIFQWT